MSEGTDRDQAVSTSGIDGSTRREDQDALASLDALTSTEVWLTRIDGVSGAQAEMIASVMNVIKVSRRSGTLRAGSITRSQASLLELLKHHGPCRLTALAEEMGVDLSVLSRQAAALEQRGLLGRAADPKDKRAFLVRLTAEGQAELDTFWTYHVQSLSAALDAFSEKDLAAAAEINNLVARTLSGGTNAGRVESAGVFPRQPSRG